MEPKFEYTQNNHYKWGYGDEWYNRADPTKQFKVHLGYCTRPVESFRQECINAAKLIASKATKPIIVGLSGGSDSQMACLSFREAGVPFKVVIVRLYDADGDILNDHDIKTAYEFCKKYNIEYIDHHVNADAFYKGPALEYAAKYGFTLVETLLQCSTMDFVGKDYCYIMAGGDIILSPYYKSITPEIDQKSLAFNEKVSSPVWIQKGNPVMQHMVEMGYEGTSKFFLYTPELIASYLLDPVTQDFLKAKDVIYQVYFNWHRDPKIWWRCFHLMHKPLLTIREWPEMILARKYTGFERLEGFMSGKHSGTRLIDSYQELVNKAANGLTSGQAVVPLIEDLLEYVTTEHTHSLESTPWIV